MIIDGNRMIASYMDEVHDRNETTISVEGFSNHHPPIHNHESILALLLGYIAVGGWLDIVILIKTVVNFDFGLQFRVCQQFESK